jgi:sugar O-acyltransferase (sialic acid O-acetyltransferase NeuD family)
MKEKPRLLIIGAGGHAESVIDVVESDNTFEIFGLIGKPDEVGATRFGYEIIGTDDALSELVKSCQFAVIGVGQIKSADQRIKLYQKIIRYGFQIPNIISPKAYVSKHAEIGPGTTVMHYAIINAGARVGANCIINTRALIEHGVEVADHCHISTGGILNGNVKIGSETFIGSGSVIRQGILIGRSCVVGMGLTVHSDLEDFGQLTCNT